MYVSLIDELWDKRDLLSSDKLLRSETEKLVSEIINKLDNGEIVVCFKYNCEWKINEWIKKAILLHFKINNSELYDYGALKWYDKIKLKFSNFTKDNFENNKQRIVPGSFIRSGSYIGKNVVIMPSFINIGAYIGDGSLIDTWSTIGSCAYVGRNCHISGGVGIGGVLEPLQSKPVIIEDNCFIGARSEIVEGVVVEEGAVISMGVFIGASTKIVERYSGKIIYGKVPAYSVVVPGSMQSGDPNLPNINCAVIIKTVDKKTREKVEINKLLRE